MNDNRIELPCDSKVAVNLGVWFHAFRFADGVDVGRSSPVEKFQLLTNGLNLESKSVIEIGCNAGGMTYLLEQAGAEVWPFDVLCQKTGRWKNQFDFVKRHLGISASYNCLDLYDLKERAQIVFMVGVYYHLSHVRLGIETAWNAATEHLIIEGEILDDEDRPIAFFPTVKKPYNGDPTNFFIPSKSALVGILERLPGVKEIVELEALPKRAAFRMNRK